MGSIAQSVEHQTLNLSLGGLSSDYTGDQRDLGLLGLPVVLDS